MTPEEILEEQGISFFPPKGKDILVSCFNPEHDDSNPSMRIDKVNGMFNCLSCGHRGSLYTLFKIARDIQGEKLRNVRTKIRDILISTKGREVPPGSIPYDRGEFKGIPSNILADYGAFTNDIEYPDRIVFPIKDTSGRIVAFNGRSLYTDLPPKYVIYPAEVEIPFFPAIVKPDKSTIILVEGLFDQINLQYRGVQGVVCLFGTNKLTDRNVNSKLQPYRLQGAQRIVIMFDGDDAGYKAAHRLEKLIKEKTEFVCSTIYLSKGLDPGVLTDEEVTNYKKIIYEDSNARR